MGKFFSEEEVDTVIAMWTEKYPSAVEDTLYAMKHPFSAESDKHSSISLRQISDIVRDLDFFKTYVSKAGDSAIFHLKIDVNEKIARRLGPIGTYEVEI